MESTVHPFLHNPRLLRNVLGVLILANAVLWFGLFVLEKDKSTVLAMHFLSVGQGDSELIIFPGGVKLLIDGGPPNGSVSRELDAVLQSNDRYIDLVMVSHPQLDHFGGLIDMLVRYRVGAFLESGRRGEISAYKDLENILEKRNVERIQLAKNDRIRYRGSTATILSPDARLLGSTDLNDTSLVTFVESASTTALFTGDIGKDAEQFIVRTIPTVVDVLKVPHHGSKFSSAASFLGAVQPILSVIEVGKNRYGHPTPQAIERLTDVGARVYRTDRDGRVTVKSDGKNLTVERAVRDAK